MSSPLHHVVVFGFIFFAICAFSLLITSILLRFVRTLGTKNQNVGAVRWSADIKPAIGGITFFIAFFLSFTSYAFLFDSSDVFENKQIIAFIAATSLGFLMGLTDDAYNTKPLLKLFIQITCGVLLIIGDSYISIFENNSLNMALTILWTVGIMNSINMLDNMDGIAATITGFIIIAVLGNMIITDVFLKPDFTILLGILAALVAFLFFNWYPSSIYMGDTGSQFLGVILAYIGIHYCWNVDTMASANGNWLGLASLLMLFLLPIVDTTIVVINRLRRKQSPFVGGKDHTTHNLVYAGLSDARVGKTFALLSSITAGAYLLLISFVGNEDYFIIGLYIAAFLVVFLIMFRLTEQNRKMWWNPAKPKPKGKARKKKTTKARIA